MYSSTHLKRGKARSVRVSVKREHVSVSVKCHHVSKRGNGQSVRVSGKQRSVSISVKADSVTNGVNLSEKPKTNMLKELQTNVKLNN